MAVDGVVTQSVKGVDGNSYTDKISNDQLTNDDFLKLMLQEMKMQDPTKPMDTQALMDSTMQMSSIQANQDLSQGMASLIASNASSSLTNAANMIGHTVENGTIGDDGLPKSYRVDSAESKDGELYLNVSVYEKTVDGLKDPETNALVIYDSEGYVYDDGEKNEDVRVALDTKGRFTFNDDGSLKLLDTDGDVITDEDITSKYAYAGSSAIYSDIQELMAMTKVTKIQ